MSSVNVYLDVVDYLVTMGASVTDRNNAGSAALLWAVVTNKITVVDYPLAHGSNVNVHTDLGVTSLHYDASNGKYALAKLILDNGVNINTKDNDDRTALIRAATTDSAWNSDVYLNTVQLLATHPGVDLSERSNADYIYAK